MCGVAMPHDIYCSYIILDSYMRNRYNSRCEIISSCAQARGHAALVGGRESACSRSLPALVALGALASKVA